MRSKQLFSIILFILISTNSCKKDPICACGVEHPEENLLWLKQNIAAALSVDVYKFTFESNDYIIISDPPGPDELAMVFDCEGNALCSIGGINPGAQICDLPRSFIKSYYDNPNNKILIYQKRYIPD